MKRISLRLGLLVLLALVGFVGLVLWATPNHRINRESFARIRPGMSKNEVESIVGCAPGAYSNDGTEREPTILWTKWTQPDNTDVFIPIEVGPRAGHRIDEYSGPHYWIGESCGFRINVDVNERVISKGFFVVEQDNVVGRMRRWLTSFRE
jgi:hypothetical protein